MFSKLSRAAVRASLEEFHQREPLRAGINKEELFGRVPGTEWTASSSMSCIQRLIRQGDVVQEKDLVRLSSHQVALAGKQEEVKEKSLKQIYQQAGLAASLFPGGGQVAWSLRLEKRKRDSSNGCWNKDCWLKSRKICISTP